MKVTQRCSECGRRVFVLRSIRAPLGRGRGQGRLTAHDLCDRCHRALGNKTVAARSGPKPEWAIRGTLDTLEGQPRRIVSGSQRV